MSSTPAKNATKSKSKTPGKPKRPLSGYNLFYRYKRIKVLEAAAHPTNGGGTPEDAESVIRDVVAALPGLEGVAPDSPVHRSSPAHVDEFRATAIRAVMEGKLFPNENRRKRLHRKLHGVGFVEMGRMMRQLWGRADEFTKGVFCELAEVGRVRYKKLAAEYKLKCEIEQAEGDAMELAEGASETSKTPDAKKSGTAGLGVKTAVTPSLADEIDPMAAEASAKRAKTPTISNQSKKSKVEPAPAAKSKADRALAGADATVPTKAEGGAKPASDPVLEDRPMFALTTDDRPPDDRAKPEKSSRPAPGYRRRVSHELDFASPATAKPPAVSAPAVDGEDLVETSYRRTVSKEYFDPRMVEAPREGTPTSPAGGGDAPSAVVAVHRPRGKALVRPGEISRASDRTTGRTDGDVPGVPEGDGRGRRAGRRRTSSSLDVRGGAVSPDRVRRGSSARVRRGPRVDREGRRARQRLRLRRAIEKLREQIIQRNALLPPEMRVSPREYEGPGSGLGDASTPPPSDDRGEEEEAHGAKEDEYTKDFVKMIGTLGEAIDERSKGIL